MYNGCRINVASKPIYYSMYFLFISGSSTPLTIRITTNTVPDTKEIRYEAQINVYTQLTSEETVTKLAQDLSKKLEATVKLNNVRLGSIMVDMILGDLSKLEYIKYLSDNWVLSNMVDNILITPEFITTCQAEDVALDVVVDEDSYKHIMLSSKLQVLPGY